MESKELWRAFAREKFKGEEIDHAQFVDGIAEFLEKACPAGAIVSYNALDDEVDLALLAERVDEGRLCLTRTPELGVDLTIHELDGHMLERHRYGFMQPIATAPEVPDSEVAAVLVPGLIFDQSGTRLGHGKGYYDRFLARMKPGVHIVGVTKNIVLEQALPAEVHDVSMTYLATSRGVKAVSSTRH